MNTGIPSNGSVILYGIDANGNPVPFRLNDDGTLSSAGGGGSVSPYTSNPEEVSVSTQSPGNSGLFSRGNHIHKFDASGYQSRNEKDQASGFAGLDSNGLINPARLPGIVRTISFGIVTAVEVATNGPRLLYTPGAGEKILAALIEDIVLTDQDDGIGIGPILAFTRNDGSSDPGILARVDSTHVYSQYKIVSDLNVLSGGILEIVSTDEAVYAAWMLASGTTLADGLTNIVPAATGIWQANHVYTDEVIIMPDVNNSNKPIFWQASAGISGAISPVFSSIGTVIDNTTTWTSLFSVVPTVGSFKVTLFVVAPIAG